MNRDRSVICVVEQAQDVSTIENSHEFSGLFHVLGGVISPLDGIGPDQLRIASLVDRVRDGNVREVILATNPTVEGDTTAFTSSMYSRKRDAPLPDLPADFR